MCLLHDWRLHTLQLSKNRDIDYYIFGGDSEIVVFECSPFCVIYQIYVIMSIDTLIIIFGLLFIFIGSIIKISPNLVSGYNTMSEKEKENVEIDKLAGLYQIGFIAIGLITIGCYYLFMWLKLVDIAQSMIIVPILVGILILLIMGRKYDHNKSKLKSNIAIAVIAISNLLIFTLIPYSYMPTEIDVKSDGVSFSGVYSTIIAAKDIADVELLDSIPAITMKVNGFGFASVRKGYFKVADYGKCRLFMNGYAKPFLVITTKDGKRTIFCNPNKGVAENYYKQINKLVNIEK